MPADKYPSIFSRQMEAIHVCTYLIVLKRQQESLEVRKQPFITNQLPPKQFLNHFLNTLVGKYKINTSRNTQEYGGINS